MIPVNEFRTENQEISNLCAVLHTLLGNDKVITNPIVCELFERFHKQVGEHLEHEDRSAYGELLRHHGDTATRLAAEFMENTHELKKILHKHNKKWCNGANEKDISHFKQETMDLFKLVDQRLSIEEHKLFPILQQS